MSFRAVQHGDRVLILIGGKLAADLCYQTAKETARALMHVANVAEEHAKAERVIADSALFLRASGLGLPYNPALTRAAHKEAQWSREARRVKAIEGIPRSEEVGRPSVTNRRGDR